MTTNNHAVANEGTGRQSDLRSVGHPRLMTLRRAAEYMGVSYWLLRDYCLDGTLKPIRLPGSRLKKNGRLVANSKDHLMRKIMLDREDLDRLIAECKGD
jgi:predicted site-specific integrase-resolvase